MDQLHRFVPEYRDASKERVRRIARFAVLGIVAVALLGGTSWYIADRIRTGLARDTRAALAAPGTAEGEQQAYAELIQKLAKDSPTLTIRAECAMDPLVLRLAQGKALQVRNADTIQHTIAFEDQNFFTVSAGQTRTIDFKSVFSKTAGIYRYRCSDSATSTNAGVLYITP